MEHNNVNSFSVLPTVFNMRFLCGKMLLLNSGKKEQYQYNFTKALAASSIWRKSLTRFISSRPQCATATLRCCCCCCSLYFGSLYSPSFSLRHFLAKLPKFTAQFLLTIHGRPGKSCVKKWHTLIFLVSAFVSWRDQFWVHFGINFKILEKRERESRILPHAMQGV